MALATEVHDKTRAGMKTTKRKAGPGRKPAGTIRSKISNFSTRITAETRQALETEARAAGQSVSQIAEQFLRLGIRTKRDRERPDAIRALCYVVAELSELLCNFKAADGKPAFDWRTSPFMFEALRLAIQKFMDQIKPAGDARSPIEDEPGLANSTLWGPYDTPDARAGWAVMILWHNLQSIKAERLTADMFSIPLPLDALTDMERTAYSMARAREDLQIEFRRNRP
jgi:hypothetical protein